MSHSGHAYVRPIIFIARCPEHGLHGERTECFECGGPVQQVPMVAVGAFARDDFDAEEQWVKYAQDAHTRAAKAEEALAAMRERAEGAERERDDAVEGVEALEDLVCCVEQVSYEGIAGEVEELDEARRVAGDVLARLRSNEKGAGDRG